MPLSGHRAMEKSTGRWRLSEVEAELARRFGSELHLELVVVMEIPRNRLEGLGDALAEFADVEADAVLSL